MTYAGLKSMIYAGLSKDDPRVKAAWDWVRKNWTLDENPGMRLNNPQAAQYGLYYYFHTLARALNAYDEPTLTDAQGNRHDWRVELVDKLAGLQKADGSFAGEKRFMEDNPVLVTSYVAIALAETIEDLRQHPPKPAASSNRAGAAGKENIQTIRSLARPGVIGARDLIDDRPR
jgi:squalene-hopene/tetraprenyl-beta-curcumene cyclase